MAFDTGACRLAYGEINVVKYTHSSATTAWTPIYVSGQGVLIPKSSYSASVAGAFYKRGIINFIVASGVTVTAGNRIYYDSTNGVVQTTSPTAGFPLGTALSGGTGTSAGSVVVNVDINTFGVEGNVNVYASTGLFKASYASIDLAVAALAANDILTIRSGTYTLAGACDIEVAGVKIIGDGIVEVNGASGADYCFKTVLGALTSTAELWFDNLTINHDDDATQVGIQVDDTDATKKLNVYVNNCDFNTGGGNSIDVDHPDTSNAIRVYCDGCYFEGPFNAVTIDNGDRFRFSNCSLQGGLVTDAGDVDTEILLTNCKVLHEGITGGAANQRLICIGCFTETDADPNVYAALDTNDAAGSHTEQLLSYS